MILGRRVRHRSGRLRACLVVAAAIFSVIIATEEHIPRRLVGKQALFGRALGYLELAPLQMLHLLPALPLYPVLLLDHPHFLIDGGLEGLPLLLPFRPGHARHTRGRLHDRPFSWSVRPRIPVNNRLHVEHGGSVLHRLLQLAAKAHIFPLARVLVAHDPLVPEPFPVLKLPPPLLACRSLSLTRRCLLPVLLTTSTRFVMLRMAGLFHAKDLAGAHAVVEKSVRVFPVHALVLALLVLRVLSRLVKLVVSVDHSPALARLPQKSLATGGQHASGLPWGRIRTCIINDSCLEIVRFCASSAALARVEGEIGPLLDAIVSRFAVTVVGLLPVQLRDHFKLGLVDFFLLVLELASWRDSSGWRTGG